MHTLKKLEFIPRTIFFNSDASNFSLNIIESQGFWWISTFCTTSASWSQIFFPRRLRVLLQTRLCLTVIILFWQAFALALRWILSRLFYFFIVYLFLIFHSLSRFTSSPPMMTMFRGVLYNMTNIFLLRRRQYILLSIFNLFFLLISWIQIRPYFILDSDLLIVFCS